MSNPPVSPGEPPDPDQPPYAQQPPYADPLAAPPPPPPPAFPPPVFAPPDTPTAPEPPTTVQPPMAPQPPYGAQPQYGGQPQYGAQPQYAAQPPYATQPPYPGAPGYPTSAPPYGQAPTAPISYPPGALAAPPKKSNKTLIIVLSIVAGLLLLCCIGGALTFVIRANNAINSTSAPLPDRQVTINPGNDQPTGPGGPTGETFNLGVGKTATITDEDGSFTLTVLSAKWYPDNCDDNSFFPPPDGKILAIEVTFEVKSGSASINPLFFNYRDSQGRSADFSFFSGCDDPMLDSGNNLRTGTKRTGMFAFDVTGSQTGLLEYDNAFETAASWKITA